MQLAIMILAAGRGTRMKSALPKVMHVLHGFPLIHYPLTLAQKLDANPVVLVHAQNNGALAHYIQKQKFKNIKFALQEPQLGTGHAVQCAASELGKFEGNVLILCGDMPLIRFASIQNLLFQHQKKRALLSVLTAHFDKPGSYGRIVRGKNNELLKIQEAKDATLQEKNISEINTGVFVFAASFLQTNLPKLQNINKQKEYYLTDLVQIAAEQNLPIAWHTLDDPVEAHGINDQEQLIKAEKILSDNDRGFV